MNMDIYCRKVKRISAYYSHNLIRSVLRRSSYVCLSNMAKHILGFIYFTMFKRPDFHYVFAQWQLTIKENILCIKGICL